MDTGSEPWTGWRLMSRQTQDLRAQKFLIQRNAMGLCGAHRAKAIVQRRVSEAAAATVQLAVVPPIWNETLILHAFGFFWCFQRFSREARPACGSASRVAPDDRCLRCNRPIPHNEICRSGRN